jgi:hypothetical protein
LGLILNSLNIIGMGYMGFGLQKWIYNMKPRKPFKKSNKNSGFENYDQSNREFKLKESYSSNPEILDERINEAKRRIKFNIRLDNIHSSIYIISLLALAIFAFFGINNYGERNQETQTIMSSRKLQEEKNALTVVMKSGINYLNNNEIENAIKEFELAITIEPKSEEALYYYVLSLSIDCENNNRNCESSVEFFETLKTFAKKQRIESLETRMVIVEEKLKLK